MADWHYYYCLFVSFIKYIPLPFILNLIGHLCHKMVVRSQIMICAYLPPPHFHFRDCPQAANLFIPPPPILHAIPAFFVLSPSLFIPLPSFPSCLIRPFLFTIHCIPGNVPLLLHFYLPWKCPPTIPTFFAHLPFKGEKEGEGGFPSPPPFSPSSPSSPSRHRRDTSRALMATPPSLPLPPFASPFSTPDIFQEWNSAKNIPPPSCRHEWHFFARRGLKMDESVNGAPSPLMRQVQRL